eukprot:CAMPEP_0198129936 /NCGR_PEP_ID=MMETSP1442-20131203/52827_1 /TAXON_ID= /ORGANISM="Craspedostauros australis, Strain CCMP3328" /LENGTH=398 /DNA_ID=CAMNT_0043790439 /DNA_START=269 /DNA_END=1465 /DNA_ORIENTATION=+
MAVRKCGMAIACVVAMHLSCAIPRTQAWGTEGHEIVANIAYERLSQDAKDFVQAILGNMNNTKEAGSPLAAVADWADRVRPYYHWSGALHYIDVSDDQIDGGCPINTTNAQCRFIYDRDCVDDVCVAGAIQNYTKQLQALPAMHLFTGSKRRQFVQGIDHAHGDQNLRGSQSAPHTMNERRLLANQTVNALKFLTHFVGDVHQPLHCSRTTDKGGNDFHVKFDDSSALTAKPSRRGPANSSTGVHVINSNSNGDDTAPSLRKHHSWNLHSVWDTGIIDKAIHETYGTRQMMEQSLIGKSHSPAYHDKVVKWLSCSDGSHWQCPARWGQESFDDAMKWAYTNSDGTEVVNGSELNDDYYATRVDIVQDRLIAGGVRLATILEQLVKGWRISGAVRLRFE